MGLKVFNFLNYKIIPCDYISGLVSRLRERKVLKDLKGTKAKGANIVITCGHGIT